MTTSIKKYELVKENRQGHLYQIRALFTFSDVKKGDLGGFIECEDNLSHYGNCWVYDNARVGDGAVVKGNAQIRDNAQIYQESIIKGTAIVTGNAEAYDCFYIDNGELWEDCKAYFKGNGCTYLEHCNEDGYCPECGATENEDGYCSRGR